MPEQKSHKTEVDVVERARGFWETNNKKVVFVGIAIIVLLGGWIVNKYMIQAPKAQKSDDLVYVTQKYFSEFSVATDSAKILLAAKCLNGDGVNPGALKIISNYAGTPAANLCEFYAGACYLHLGQFEKAIKYLKDFDADGATQIKSRAYGMIADANAELNKTDEALSYYKKAAEVNNKDEFTSSEFLFKAALFAETAGKTKEAIDLFKQIKSNYPLTEKAADVDRYLAKLGEVSE